MLNVNKKRPWGLDLALIGLLVGLDQLSKSYFQKAGLVVQNPGGVLGILPEFWWLWLLTVVWLLLFRHWRHHSESWYGLGLLLILSGGLGNLIDRAVFGWVRDFLYYPGLGFYGNGADIALFGGVVVAIVSRLVKSDDEQQAGPEDHI